MWERKQGVKFSMGMKVRAVVLTSALAQVNVSSLVPSGRVAVCNEVPSSGRISNRVSTKLKDMLNAEIFMMQRPVLLRFVRAESIWL